MAIILVAFGSGTAFAFAPGAETATATAGLVLPALSEPDDEQAGHVQFNDNEIEFGYDTKHGKWLATATYDDDAMAVSGHAGVVLNKRLASGATASFDKHQKEVLLNHVLTMGRRAYLRISMGWLLDSPFQDGNAGATLATTQRSRLIELRRTDRSAARPADVGVSAYSASARTRGPGSLSQARADDAGLMPASISSASLHGYAVSVWLTPSIRSQLRLDFGTHRRVTDRGGVNEARHAATAHHAQYSFFLKSCARLQAEYSADSYQQATQVALEKQAWRVALSASRVSASGKRDIALVFGYSVPLGQSTGATKTCLVGANMLEPQAPLIDRVVERPDGLPAELDMPPGDS